MALLVIKKPCQWFLVIFRIPIITYYRLNYRLNMRNKPDSHRKLPTEVGIEPTISIDYLAIAHYTKIEYWIMAQKWLFEKLFTSIN